MAGAPPGQRRVVVVTGGGGGIGGAVAEELGRQGAFVVTLDPMVTLDGSEALPKPEDTTAGRIVAAGGAARASFVSVTDGDAVRQLFDDLVHEHGRLDGVINVAGISRPTSFASGSEDDWSAVLAVHLDGYLNILGAALPIMVERGSGRILGVTSGSGWRPADTGAYACAKRAVAALTWQLGAVAPAGVSVNAMSPIAATRMVTAALGRAAQPGSRRSGSAATGGLSLASMPTPDQLGPFGAHLVGEDVGWCRGQVLFAGGPEIAVIDQPRLLEVVRSDGVGSLAHLLEAATPGALAPAEAQQASTGAGNPRLATAFDAAPDAELAPSVVSTCALVTDRPDLAAAVTAALDRRAVRSHVVEPPAGPVSFAAAAGALAASVDRHGPVDALVVALGAAPAAPGPDEWAWVLAEHADLADQIHTDAAWVRAIADHAAAVDRPVRLVTLTDATTAGGRSRAQASAQLARASRRATDERVTAFAVSDESGPSGEAHSLGDLVAHLVCSLEAPALSGAELAVGPGWIGLRSHPHPKGSVSLGGPEVPPWLDATMREIVGSNVSGP